MTELPCYHSDEEIREVARRFEDCSYRPEEFHHAQHLTVIVWYLAQLGPEAALKKIREALLKFTKHYGKTAYHESITCFWVSTVNNHLRQTNRDGNLAAVANEVIERLGNKDLIYEHYSRDRIMSPEAKAEWVEPDLKPLSRGAPTQPPAFGTRHPAPDR
ncbi:MAG: hypothetical protein WBC04_03870 [Candidatus Acidiferrales bacterium]